MAPADLSSEGEPGNTETPAAKESASDQTKQPSLVMRVISLIVGLAFIVSAAGEESMIERAGEYAIAAAFFLNAAVGGFRASPDCGWPYYAVRFFLAIAIGSLAYRLLLLF